MAVSTDTVDFSALQIADWRLQVFALYARVRELSLADPSAAHLFWQHERDRLVAEHPATPLLAEDRQAFTGLLVADYDPDWRFECTVVPPDEAVSRVVETGTDGSVPFELLGTVGVADFGTLDVWRLTSYGGGLFLPIRDGLAGRPGGTYGGGRYLLDTVKGAYLGTGSAQNSLIIDFNFAYQPSCAYDPAWACPLAQAGNTLAAPIPVGEFYQSATR
ncbi:MAG: DUF1684 domain-containing protein [Terrimesophilobacter sp.]